MILPISDHLGQTRARIRFRMLAQKKTKKKKIGHVFSTGAIWLLYSYCRGALPKKKNLILFFKK